MSIDPFMISTAVLGVTTIVALSSTSKWKGRFLFADRRRCSHLDTILSLEGDLAIAKTGLVLLQTADQKRRAHARAAGAKGHAVQSAKAMERRALKSIEATEAVAKTLDSLKATTFRPREKVVAPVQRKRAKAKAVAAGDVLKSGAGVAAKQGGWG